MAEETGITPKTITELKQVSPEELAQMSEDVISCVQSMNNATNELEYLSQNLHCLSAAKELYDKSADKVRTQMRNLMVHI